MPDITVEVGSAPVLGPVLLVFCVLLAVRAARGTPGWTGGPALTRLTAAGCAAAVLHLTLFPIAITWGPMANQTPWSSMVNWIPLVTADLSFVPNVLLLAPFGALLPLTRPGAFTAGGVLGRSLALSLAIETIQLLCYLLFHNGRSVDVNDLIANALGGLLGFLAVRRSARTSALGPLVRRLALPGSAFAAETAPVRS